MKLLLRLLYAAAAKLATIASGIVPPSDNKAVIAVRARHGLRQRYASWAERERDPARPLLWMHAPSVGEGLQARPVLALVRERHPDLQLAYTFFSPSAEEFSRSLDVDFRDYLPFDEAGEMRAALASLRPRALVFSKLDVWPALVCEAKDEGVRVGVISATLGPASRRRTFLGSALLRDAYAALDAVGAVDEEDADRLVQLGVRRNVVEITGDTRVDQVWLRAQHVDRESRLLRQLRSERPTIVAGSTWPPDEEPLLDGFVRARARIPDLRLIIAPHELGEPHLRAIERWAGGVGYGLARVDGASPAADVVLVDRFGLLGDLYALATVAFVGGGFHDAGLHSVLEPAAYGAPVLFGPRYDRSRDAHALLAAGGARCVRSATDVERTIVDWLEDVGARRAVGESARALVTRGRGAAERSVALVERLLR